MSPNIAKWVARGRAEGMTQIIPIWIPQVYMQGLYLDVIFMKNAFFIYLLLFFIKT